MLRILKTISSVIGIVVVMVSSIFWSFCTEIPLIVRVVLSLVFILYTITLLITVCIIIWNELSSLKAKKEQPGGLFANLKTNSFKHFKHKIFLLMNMVMLIFYNYFNTANNASKLRPVNGNLEKSIDAELDKLNTWINDPNAKRSLESLLEKARILVATSVIESYQKDRPKARKEMESVFEKMHPSKSVSCTLDVVQYQNGVAMKDADLREDILRGLDIATKGNYFKRYSTADANWEKLADELKIWLKEHPKNSQEK